MASSEGAVLYYLEATDPYLQYKPDGAYSFQTQLVVNGIIVSLLSVLCIHLLFTSQYHFPIAKLNYCLQLSGVVTVLATVAATLGIVMDAGGGQTDEWPYMLDFVAKDIPPANWTLPELVTWYSIEAVSSGIVQITHIQFLTLLYPSAMEARLIFGLLGPIAIVSSACQFLSLSSSQYTTDLGRAVRNICNSTLALLFTVSLFIWGFVVNRKRAWRMDGGTAAFGAGALILAVTSTAVNFVEVRVDEVNWLQHLLWSLILWQSWLGWWWWVGSGMGIGEVEDMLEREEKKRLKSDRKKKLKSAKAQSSKLLHRSESISTSAFSSGRDNNVVNRIMNNIDSSTGSRRRKGKGRAEPSAPIELDVFSSSNSNGNNNSNNNDSSSAASGSGSRPTEDQSITSSPVASSSRRTIPDGERDRDITLPLPITTPSRRRTNSNNVSGSPLMTYNNSNNDNNNKGAATDLASGSVPASAESSSSSTKTPSLHPPNSLRGLLDFPSALVNRVMHRISKEHDEAIKRRTRERVPQAGRAPGWGLGEFGVREMQDGAERVREVNERLRGEMLLNADNDLGSGDGDDGDPNDWVDEDVLSKVNRRGTEPVRNDDSRKKTSISSSISRPLPNRRRESNSDDEGGGATSWSLWGPLKNWRKRDASAWEE